jgi:hypothetical protein
MGSRWARVHTWDGAKWSFTFRLVRADMAIIKPMIRARGDTLCGNEKKMQMPQLRGRDRRPRPAKAARSRVAEYAVDNHRLRPRDRGRGCCKASDSAGSSVLHKAPRRRGWERPVTPADCPARCRHTAPTLLSVNGIEVIYNHVILVLKGVSLVVPEGGIVALLGANGAGKTTTLRAVSNLLHAERGEVTKGSIEYKGEKIHDLTAYDLVRRGVVQVMEGPALLRAPHGRGKPADRRLHARAASRAQVAADLEKVYAFFPRLKSGAPRNPATPRAASSR